MKKIYVLKIGGSVATQKNRRKLFLRRLLLKKVAKNIKEWRQKNPKNDLIVIHGAGGRGHYLAKKYNLSSGTKDNKRKLKGAVLSRIANQKLDLEIFKIFVEEGLMAMPIHTSSVVIQENKRIMSFDVDVIEHTLRNNCVPVLYGEMVFDEKIGMSICSGDASAAHLAKKFKAEKVLFATDVDGVFDKDPHLHKDAKLIESIKLGDIYSANISLGKSHSLDVTDGLRGKLRVFSGFLSNYSLKEIVVFNGTNSDNYRKILNGSDSVSTRILLK